jgi:SAM-dependent methyltransferase
MARARPPSSAVDNASMSETPWFEAAFRADYLAVYAHRDQASATREVAFLVEQGLRGRVLDLCCGQGRHLIAMRAAGLWAHGLDLSHELLVRAPRLEGGESTSGRLVRGDQRALPFADASHDAVALLFSSFGYHDDAGDLRVLREVRRILRPGGQVFLDLMNPARIRASLVPHSQRERQGVLLEETRSLSPDGRRVRKRVVMRRVDGGGERAWHEDVRLYEPGELDAALASAGLTPTARFADFQGAPFGADAERQLVRAEAHA